MKREIYEVYAKVVDANGAYNTLSGYPKVFDSHQNNDDLEKVMEEWALAVQELTGFKYIPSMA